MLTFCELSKTILLQKRHRKARFGCLLRLISLQQTLHVARQHIHFQIHFAPNVEIIDGRLFAGVRYDRQLKGVFTQVIDGKTDAINRNRAFSATYLLISAGMFTQNSIARPT